MAVLPSNLSQGAKLLYETIPGNCWLTAENLSKRIGCRKLKIADYKAELEDRGLITIYLHPNGKRTNPVHQIIKHLKPIKPLVCEHFRRAYCMSEWPELDRNSQVECYLKSNWNILPFAERSKCPVKGLCIDEWNRKPLAAKMDFFFNNPGLNIGAAVCPHQLIVDVDAKTSEWLEHENFRNTLTVSTPRGHHLYFQNDAVITTSAKVLPDIDTRGPGNFIVLPGSIHPDGELYRWEKIARPQRLPQAFRTAWRVADYQHAKRSGRLLLPETVEQGTRNDTLWRYGRSLRSSGKNEFEIETELAHVNRRRCSPPLSGNEMYHLIQNVLNRADKPGFISPGRHYATAL